MQLISKADDLFKSKLYSDARVSYEEALKIKDDTYAKAQVDKIIEEQKAFEIRSEQAALKEKLDRDYNTAIADADRLLAAKDLEKALTRYSEAASLKPGEQYPKDKIAEINFTFIAQEESRKPSGWLSANRPHSRTVALEEEQLELAPCPREEREVVR